MINQYSADAAQGEGIMQLLHNMQSWELSRSRHEEMLREAHNARLVRMAQSQRPAWWQRLLNRPRPQVAFPLAQSAAPELG
jgi:hypothetical protein